MSAGAECPNCLRPRATPEDWTTFGDRPIAESAHLCFGSRCARPAELDLSTAEIRDLRAERDALQFETARLVDPVRLPPLWFVYYEEHKGEGSQVVAAMDEDVAARVGALALGMDHPDPDGIGVVACDPHALAAEIRDLRAGFAAMWAEVERLRERGGTRRDRTPR